MGKNIIKFTEAQRTANIDQPTSIKHDRMNLTNKDI